MTDFQFFMPIAKVDAEARTVMGYASTPTKDGDGEIVTLDAIKGALPGYMEWANVREMHALKAVGVTEEANIDTKGLYITARITDDAAWQKCVDKVYKGFSIGGRKLAKSGNKITEIDMTEISIVDRPSNPDARFALAKSHKTLSEEPGYLVKVKKARSAESKALSKMARIVEDLAKAGPPAAHDGFSLPAKKAEVVEPSPKDDSEQNNKADGDAMAEVCKTHGVKECMKCAAMKAAGEAPCKDHGKFNCDKCTKAAAKALEIVDLGKREFSSAQRDDAATSGAAMSDGSFPIENKSDLSNAIQAFGRAKDKDKAKAHITARAKSLGAEDALPSTWTGGKDKAKKIHKAEKTKLLAAFGIVGTDPFILYKSKALVSGIAEEAAPVFEIPRKSLKKSMGVAGSLSYCFDSVREAQRRLMMEAKREGGDMKDKKLAKELGVVAQTLAGIISQKATHEGEEALDFSDADDQYLSQFLGEDFDMALAAKTIGGSGDPLADAFAALMKRAASPTRAQTMAAAADNVKKARKAAKDARESIEEVHKMLKASYVAKMAKARGGKKPADDNDEDDFDHAGAMEKLQKAHGDVEKARTMAKAASNQIEKASRSGQRGQEAGDPLSGFYEVPAGVTDLTPAALAGAAPGSKSGGSQPPMYPVDGGVFPGKAAGGDLRKYIGRDGTVPASVVELLMEKAANAGELEALRRLPAAGRGGGRGPYSFDMTKVMAGNTGGHNNDDLHKALFDGVDVGALSSDDEQTHTAASAKVIGNFLTNGGFGKSILDPSFKGAAGSAR